MQNADGGWATFGRTADKLRLDRSAADLTANALRALHAWRNVVRQRDLELAVSAGLAFLAQQQDADGHWVPQWFGNPQHPYGRNPVYGTATALLAHRDLGVLHAQPAQRALNWLRDAQNADGGWGSGLARGPSGKHVGGPTSVEETAWAVEALLAVRDDPAYQGALDRGLDWLVEAVETGRHTEPAPIGLFANQLWYYEALYPLIFVTSALSESVRRLASAGDDRAAEVQVLFR